TKCDACSVGTSIGGLDSSTARDGGERPPHSTRSERGSGMSMGTDRARTGSPAAVADREHTPMSRSTDDEAQPKPRPPNTPPPGAAGGGAAAGRRRGLGGEGGGAGGRRGGRPGGARRSGGAHADLARAGDRPGGGLRRRQLDRRVVYLLPDPGQVVERRHDRG